MTYNTIIIGGGMAGLNTCLNHKNKNILLIESNNRLGGRVASVDLNHREEDYNYEAGAIRFYPTHTYMLNLLERYGYKKEKDFYIIPKNFKIQKIFVKSDQSELKQSEKQLNTKLLTNRKKFDESYLLNITFETYAKKILGQELTNRIKVLNAFPHIFTNTSASYGLDLLQRDFHEVDEFYILKSPLSELIQKMTNSIKEQKKKIKLNEKFISFKELENNIIEVKTNKNKYYCKNLVLAIPYDNLMKIPSLKDINKLVDTVNPIPLNRMFAIFPKDNYWHEKLPAVYTDLPVQRIYKKGSELIQIAYSSGKNAEYWKKMEDNKNDDKKVKKVLTKQLKQMFPKKEIKDPEILHMNYWSNGVHLWKKGVNKNNIIEKIIKPYKEKNLYLIGESYSYEQRWMEGALESSERALSLMKEYR